MPGVDFTREIELTRELASRRHHARAERGELHRVRALARGAARGRAAREDEVRVLKLVARTLRGLRRLSWTRRGGAVARSGSAGSRSAARRRIAAAYLRLVQAGYRVHWTDLRMTLQRLSRAVTPARAVVMSNWEI